MQLHLDLFEVLKKVNKTHNNIQHNSNQSIRDKQQSLTQDCGKAKVQIITVQLSLEFHSENEDQGMIKCGAKSQHTHSNMTE